MKKNNKKGFTLVELVIVVAVMAILVAIAIPTVGAITNKAKTAVDNSNAKTLESMIKLAEANAVEASNGAATVDFGESEIAWAIVDAKLGITTGSFTYNSKTGTVVTGKNPASLTADYYVINFKKDTNGKDSVEVLTTTATSGTTLALDAEHPANS